jgi:hypothetical protein
MKKLLLTLALLLLPSAALAQCNGAFGTNQVCGSIAGGIPGPVNFAAFPLTPPLILPVNNLGQTNSDALELVNTTPTTSGVPFQYSPSAHWSGNWWNGTGSVSQTQDIIAWLQPQGSGGGTSGVGQPNLAFSYQIAGGGYTQFFNLFPNGFDLIGVGNNNTAVQLTDVSTTAAQNNQFAFFRKLGTGAVTNSTNIAAFEFWGYDGTSYQNPASIFAAVDNTVSTGVVPVGFTFYTGSTQTAALNLSSSQVATFYGAVLSNSPTGGTGYKAGAGGTVTQITSRTTGVTLNTVTGAITLLAAAPVVGTYFTFTVTNSTVAATDVVVVSVKSATDTYIAAVSAVAAGSFNITAVSTLGTTSDSPVINFAVIKGSAT